MVGPQFRRMLTARRSDHFREGMGRRLVEIIDPFGLVGHHEPPLSPLIHCGNAGRATIGLAFEGLDTPQRKHEAARRIDPVRPKGKARRHLKRGDLLARGREAHFILEPCPDQRIAPENEPVSQRCTDMVEKLCRRAARAAFGPIHHDEIRSHTGLEHGFDQGEHLMGLAHTHLYPHRLVARKLPQAGDEVHHFQRGRKGAMIGG